MNRFFRQTSRFSLTTLSILVAALAVAPVANAHPGHSLMDHGLAHLMVSPFHLSVLAIFGFSFWTVAWFARRAQVRRVCLAIGTLALAATAVLWGLQM